MMGPGSSPGMGGRQIKWHYNYVRKQKTSGKKPREENLHFINDG